MERHEAGDGWTFELRLVYHPWGGWKNIARYLRVSYGISYKEKHVKK